MATILEVLSVSGKNMVKDDVFGNQDKCYLTLGDTNPASENRYYVSLSGLDANLDWQEGDYVMVELAFWAFKHKGQWCMSHHSDAMKVIDINCKQDNYRKNG